MKLIPVKTKDGSLTIYSKEYNEHYHSLKDGALNESLYKHIIPAFEKCKDLTEVNILDICFGIGFNTLTTIYYAKKIGFKGKINIYSPELNGDLVRSLKLLQYPKEFLDILDIIYAVSNNQRYKDNNFTVEVDIGNAINYVKKFDNKFDIIYQDAFSSKKNPELWTQEFFSSLFRSLKSDGILTTYSQARGIREIMKSTGFILEEQKINQELNIRSGTIGIK